MSYNIIAKSFFVHVLLTLRKHLGYFNSIFRLSELHQCDQEMLLGRFS